MSKLVILHFNPLELYPPIHNLLNLLSKNLSGNEIIVVTTNSTVLVLGNYIPPSANIRIIRFGHSGQQIGLLKRYWAYFSFNIGALFYLILAKPQKLFYFETISSFPAYLYKRFFNSKTNIFTHYHEYTSPTEYKNGMKQVKLFHYYEKWLYPYSSWVSHTNEYRMVQFLSDVKPVVVNNPQVLPNYPPQSWYAVPSDSITKPIKVVYIGALSLETMFLKEFVEFVNQQNGDLIFDIYAYNLNTDTKEFLISQNSERIRLNTGFNYNELPEILKAYDVGVILYKGHIPNYIYNAPNKLFEYHISGLDVWFPDVMIGSKPYVTENTFPKILAVDFRHLDQVNLNEMINRNWHINQPYDFFCEEVLDPLCEKLLNDAS